MEIRKKSIFWIWIGISILAVVCGSFIAERLSQDISTNSLLDAFYLFMRNHLWQGLAMVSLGLGVWFSFIRRRILLSMFMLATAFLAAFVFPVIF